MSDEMDIDARLDRALAILAPAAAEQGETSCFLLSAGCNNEFSETLPPATPFPTAVFPRGVERLVEQGAAAMGVAPDLIGTPLLAMAGAAVGNCASIEIKRAWRERPILWTAVVARPGAGKTPALALARSGIDALELDARERHRIALDAWQQEGEKGPRPLQEDVFTTDSTMEAVASMLSRTRGMAMVRDELAGWVHSMDAYRRGGDRQAWLSLWAGVPPKVTRKTADPVFVLDPVICLTGGIQPDLLPLLLGNPGVRDGLPDRLLLSCPETAPRAWTEQDVEESLADRLAGLFRALRVESGTKLAAPLEPDARASWIAWYDEVAQAAAGEAGLMEGFLAKAPSQVARLALVLHCLHWPTDIGRPVSLATMQDAIALWRYFHDHYRRALAIARGPSPPVAPAPAVPERLAGSPPDREQQVVERILVLLGERGAAGVSRANLTRALAWFAPAPDVSAALHRLEQEGRIHREQAETRGRPAEMLRLAHPISRPASPEPASPLPQA
jgi:hypothetical protein